MEISFENAKSMVGIASNNYRLEWEDEQKMTVNWFSFS